MKKYTPRYYTPSEINFENHWAVGIDWTVSGSKGNEYQLAITPKGFTCNCTGMTYHGKCKHTQQAAERFIEAASPDFDRYYRYE